MPKRSHPPRRQTAQSNTYRFFVNAGALHGRQVLIEDAELVHQLGTVLRLRAGEQVLLLDNSGWQYVVTLDSIERDRVSGTVERKQLAGGETRTKLTLYVALLRAERFEWVLQKGTELGVSAFVPLICERSTIADADELSANKLERWQRIIREAAEQARRGKLPRLAPALFFPAACDQAAQRGTALLLWEGVQAKLPDEDNWSHKGTLEFLDNQVDETSGTIRARATFPNASGIFTAGQFGHIRVPGSEPYKAILLPETAIVTDQSQKIALVVAEDGTVGVKILRVGPHYDDMRIIREGLSPDDKVVINGLMRARPGSKVTAQMGTIEAGPQAAATE
jgi:16S rRNA (uracil1498-N3)-methyltransferase